MSEDRCVCALQIHPLTLHDLPSAAMLTAAVFPRAREQWTEGALHEALAWPHGLLVGIKDQDQLLGLAIARALLDQGELLSLAVRATQRRKGLGRALLKAVLDWVRAQQVSTLFLEVAADNVPAIGLYQTAEFIDVRRRVNYFGNGVDGLVMKKLLN